MPKPLLSARYRVVVRDPKGHIKYIEEAPSKSFILNFLYVLWLTFNLNSTDTVSVVNPDGQETTQALGQAVAWGTWLNYQAEVYGGIQVGSGTSSPSASSPYLESLILSGSSSGRLVYGSDSVTSPSLSSNPATIKITKSFINNSETTVTVSEIGFAPLLYGANTTIYGACLFIHDVLSSPISVHFEDAITVTYTLQVNT